MKIYLLIYFLQLFQLKVLFLTQFMAKTDSKKDTQKTKTSQFFPVQISHPSISKVEVPPQPTIVHTKDSPKKPMDFQPVVYESPLVSTYTPPNIEQPRQLQREYLNVVTSPPVPQNPMPVKLDQSQSMIHNLPEKPVIFESVMFKPRAPPMQPQDIQIKHDQSLNESADTHLNRQSIQNDQIQYNNKEYIQNQSQEKQQNEISIKKNQINKLQNEIDPLLQTTKRSPPNNIEKQNEVTHLQDSIEPLLKRTKMTQYSQENQDQNSQKQNKQYINNDDLEQKSSGNNLVQSNDVSSDIKPASNTQINHQNDQKEHNQKLQDAIDYHTKKKKDFEVDEDLNLIALKTEIKDDLKSFDTLRVQSQQTINQEKDDQIKQILENIANTITDNNEPENTKTVLIEMASIKDKFNALLNKMNRTLNQDDQLKSKLQEFQNTNKEIQTQLDEFMKNQMNQNNKNLQKVKDILHMMNNELKNSNESLEVLLFFTNLISMVNQ